MKKEILELIKARKVFFDGAMGTELLDRGLILGDSAERFSTYFADIIKDIHKAYFDVGVDVIHTNTYGATKISLGKKMEGKIALVNLRQVELAREVCPKNGYVAGNIGPNAALLERDGGEYTLQMFQEAFEEQIDALIKGGVDLFSIETMYYLDEAKLAVKLIKEKCNLSVAVSMTFNKGEKGYATVMGITPEKAVVELEKAGADIVGANCGSGIEDIVEIARTIRPVTYLPLWIKPNAGVPQLREGKTIYPETPEEMVRFVPDLIKTGVSMIGGCCGTTPEHIRLIAKEVRSYTDIAHKYLRTVIKFS